MSLERPDVYYGDTAERYDASRQVKAKWMAELAALESFVDAGPVLDIPFGTGRFVPIYESKGLDFLGLDISGDMLAIARRKFPGANCRRGSAYDLKNFADNEFKTAVCVRFLEWLPLERARAVLDSLRRIASTIIVTVNHGQEGQPEAYTYDHGKFLAAIDGLMIAKRLVTATIPGITSEMFKLRPAKWVDVIDQFKFDFPTNAEPEIQRIVDKHCAFLGYSSFKLNPELVSVRAEYWVGHRLGAMVERHERYSTAELPRYTNRPITVLDDGARRGRLILDGRKRANLWMKKAGPHPVLVVRPNA